MHQNAFGGRAYTTMSFQIPICIMGKVMKGGDWKRRSGRGKRKEGKWKEVKSWTLPPFGNMLTHNQDRHHQYLGSVSVATGCTLYHLPTFRYGSVQVFATPFFNIPHPSFLDLRSLFALYINPNDTCFKSRLAVVRHQIAYELTWPVYSVRYSMRLRDVLLFGARHLLEIPKAIVNIDISSKIIITSLIQK